MSKYSDGELRCSKCGFSDIRALQLDHVFNDGNDERRKFLKQGFPYKGRQMGGSNMYGWLIKNNFPNRERYQVLCANCNVIKQMDLLRNQGRPDLRSF